MGPLAAVAALLLCCCMQQLLHAAAGWLLLVKEASFGCACTASLLLSSRGLNACSSELLLRFFAAAICCGCAQHMVCSCMPPRLACSGLAGTLGAATQLLFLYIIQAAPFVR